MRHEQGWHATDCQRIVIRRSIAGGRFSERAKTLGNLVGATGFEPATPCAQGRCATRLRYAPTLKIPSVPPFRTGRTTDGLRQPGRRLAGNAPPRSVRSPNPPARSRPSRRLAKTLSQPPPHVDVTWRGASSANREVTTSRCATCAPDEHVFIR